MKKRINSMYPNIFAVPAIVLYGIFFVLPILAAFALGFTDWNINRLFTPKFTGVKNFSYLISDEYFVLALKNTFIFAALTAFFKTLFGLLLALAVTKKLRLRNYLRTIFYLPAVLSMVLVGILFQPLFKMDGMLNAMLTFIGQGQLVNDWLGNPRTALYCTIIAEIWKWSGFTMAIFIAGIQNVSQEYYEAAKIDGASNWQQFCSITLPLIQPAMNIAVVMNVIGGLKVFEQVYVMTAGGPGFSSQVLGTYIFTTFSEGRLGRSTAMGLMLFLMVYIISASTNKLFKRNEVSS